MIAELRKYLNQEPSCTAFECVFLVLDKIFKEQGEEEAMVAVQYAERHLQDWPDKYRMCSVYVDYTPQFGPHWLLVRNFDFTSATLTNVGVIALANCPYMTNLRVLDLFSNCITDKGAKALANSPYLTNLENLSLRHNNICCPGFQALANATGMPSLKKLDLQSNGAQANPKTMQAFIDSPIFQQLDSLGLSLYVAEEKTLLALVQSPLVQKLDPWSLSDWLMGDVETAIIDSPYVKECHKASYREAVARRHERIQHFNDL